MHFFNRECPIYHKVENRNVIKNRIVKTIVFFQYFVFYLLNGIFRANFVFVLSVILVEGMKYSKVKWLWIKNLMNSLWPRCVKLASSRGKVIPFVASRAVLWPLP